MDKSKLCHSLIDKKKKKKRNHWQIAVVWGGIKQVRVCCMHRETLRHSVMGKNKSTTGWSYFYQTSVHTEKIIIIKIKKRFGVFSCPKVLCLDQSLDTAGSSIPFGPLILRELIILMAPIPFHPTSWSFRAEAGKRTWSRTGLATMWFSSEVLSM